MHDNLKLQSMHKAVKWYTVTFHEEPHHISFKLPMHKADCLYKGSTIVIEQHNSDLDPLMILRQYLDSHDRLHKWHPLLWLCESGTPLSWSWYIQHLRKHFSHEYAGHSLRSGRATTLALANISADWIHLAGWWSSDTFQIYIRKNLVLLNAIISGSAAFNRGPCNSRGPPSWSNLTTSPPGMIYPDYGVTAWKWQSGLMVVPCYPCPQTEHN